MWKANLSDPEEIRIQSEKRIVAAVLADTHVIDRVGRLHPHLIPLIKNSMADLIIHAGDISHPRVLEQLGELAPVYSVRGNRDLLFFRSLPGIQRLNLNGARVVVTHGHLGVADYWRDKLENTLHGYQFARYYRRLLPLAVNADVVIFGHSHHAENQLREQVLFFNPGSCSVAEKPDYRLSFGVISVSPQAEVKAEIVWLEGHP